MFVITQSRGSLSSWLKFDWKEKRKEKVTFRERLYKAQCKQEEGVVSSSQFNIAFIVSIFYSLKTTEFYILQLDMARLQTSFSLQADA